MWLLKRKADYFYRQKIYWAFEGRILKIHGSTKKKIIYLSQSVRIYLSIYLSIYRSLYVPIYLSIYLSISVFS